MKHYKAVERMKNLLHTTTGRSFRHISTKKNLGGKIYKYNAIYEIKRDVLICTYIYTHSSEEIHIKP